MVLAERDSGFFAIERAAHRLKDDRLLSEKIGNQPGALMIVDAEDLQDAGVGEEGAGALAIGRAQLMDVLQDRPELDAVAGHEGEGALDRREPARAGECTSSARVCVRGGAASANRSIADRATARERPWRSVLRHRTRKSGRRMTAAMRGLSRKWVWRWRPRGRRRLRDRTWRGGDWRDAGDQPTRRLALLHDLQHGLEDVGRRCDQIVHGRKRS